MSSIEVPLKVLKGIAKTDPFLWDDDLVNHFCQFCGGELPYHAENCSWDFIADLVLKIKEKEKTMKSCSFCDKKEDDVQFLLVGSNDIAICASCMLAGAERIISSLKRIDEELSQLEIETKPDWVEANSIDPRDGKVYFARVDRNDYESISDAYTAAKQQADRLALRGYARILNPEDLY